MTNPHLGMVMRREHHIGITHRCFLPHYLGRDIGADGIQDQPSTTWMSLGEGSHVQNGSVDNYPSTPIQNLLSAYDEGRSSRDPANRFPTVR